MDKRKYDQLLVKCGWYIAGQYLLYAPPPDNLVRWGYQLTPSGMVKSGRVYPYSLARGEYLRPKKYANVRQGIYSGQYVMISRETPPPGCKEVKK